MRGRSGKSRSAPFISASLLLAAWYGAEGNWGDAGLTAAGMIPYFGDFPSHRPRMSSNNSAPAHPPGYPWLMKSPPPGWRYQHRRLTDLQQTLTVEEVLDILVALNEIFSLRIKDKQLLGLIGTDIERRLGLNVVDVASREADVDADDSPEETDGD